MGIVFSIKNKEIGKVWIVGKAFDNLTLLVSISKVLAKKVSIEKGISIEKAEEIVVDCIKDGMNTISEKR